MKGADPCRPREPSRGRSRFAPALQGVGRDRSRRGLTLVELLMSTALAAVIMGTTWLGFLQQQRTLRKASSLASAVDAAVILMGRVRRDIDQMVALPARGDAPFEIGDEGRRLSLYVAQEPDDDTGRPPTPTGRCVPVTYALVTDDTGRGTAYRGERAMVPGRSVSWRFHYVAPGAARRAEASIGYRGSPTGVPRLPATPLRPGRTLSPTPGTAGVSVLGGGDAGRGELVLGPEVAGSHAGPFLLFEVRVQDEGGAVAERSALFDLVNVHMTAHHGVGFPLPDGFYEAEGDLVPGDITATPIHAPGAVPGIPEAGR